MGQGDWLYVELSFNDHKVLSLIDSGASRSILRCQEFDAICKQIGRTPILAKTIDLCAVTGHPLKVLGATELSEAQLGPLPIIVVEGIQHACIIGRDLFKAKQAIINYKTGTLQCTDASFDLIPRTAPQTIDSFGPRPPPHGQRQH